MKKILTLAVALVMVFALAAPAFAAGWDYTPTPDEFEDLYLDLVALDVDYYSEVMFDPGYKRLESTYPVVAGMKVHAYAEIEIPRAADLSPDVRARITAGQGELTISTSNLENVKIYVRQGNNAPYENSSGEYEINDTCLGETFYFEIWGDTVASNKDVKITATLGVYNVWAGDEFNFYSNSGKEYTINNATANLYTVVRASERGVGVRFYTNSDGVVQNIEVANNGKIYHAINNFNGALQFVDSTVVGTQITGDEYRDVKAILDEICGAMGFGYAGQAYITRSLVTKYLGTIVEGSASLVYPSGYVQEIVTNDPGVNPPQTGDSASIAGFVMIAVALVAAAVVTVKKVRA